MTTEKTYKINNKNLGISVSIRYVRIEKGDMNEYMECSCCGASLKKGMVINGVLYGYDCGAKKVGMGKYFKNDFHRAVSYNGKVFSEQGV